MQSSQGGGAALHGLVPKTHLDLPRIEQDDASSEPSMRTEGEGSEEGKDVEGYSGSVLVEDGAGLRNGHVDFHCDEPVVHEGVRPSQTTGQPLHETRVPAAEVDRTSRTLHGSGIAVGSRLQGEGRAPGFSADGQFQGSSSSADGPASVCNGENAAEWGSCGRGCIKTGHRDNPSDSPQCKGQAGGGDGTGGGMSCMAASLLTLKSKISRNDPAEDEGNDREVECSREAETEQSHKPKKLVGEILDLLAPVAVAATKERTRPDTRELEQGRSGADMDDGEDDNAMVGNAYLGLLDDDGLLDEEELRRRDMVLGDLCEGLLSWQGLPPMTCKDVVASEFIRLRGALHELERSELNRIARLLGVRAEMTHTELSAKTVYPLRLRCK